MDDERVWAFEESLWTADAEHYRESIDDGILMVLPEPPYVFAGEAAKKAVIDTPRWDTVSLTERQVSRPQEGLIVVAYKAEVGRGGETYVAHCSSTYRWLEHGKWHVVQHQQTPPAVM